MRDMFWIRDLVLHFIKTKLYIGNFEGDKDAYR